jgi:hypothetical protein
METRMSTKDLPARPPGGAVDLASAIGALRDELLRACWDARASTLRFKPSPMELTLQVAVTSDATARAGVRWWLVEAGGELSHQSVTTQTVKLTLEPVMYDEHGPVELLVDAADPAPGAPTAKEVPLDAAG